MVYVEISRFSRVVVVDVDDGNLCYVKLVKDMLVRGGIVVVKVSDVIVDVVVGDVGVEEGFDVGFVVEFGVVYFVVGFDEFGYVYVEDVDGGFGFGCYCDCCV